MSFAVILPAAGASRRFRDKNYKKPFAPLAGRAVWLHSAERFVNRKDVSQVIVCVADEDREEFNRKFGANIAILGVEVARGGAERTETIQNALALVKPECEFVAVHDAARPCLVDKWIDQGVRGRPEERRGAARGAGLQYTQAGRGRDDRRDGRPPWPLGRPDAAGLPPRTLAGGLRRP